MTPNRLVGVRFDAPFAELGVPTPARLGPLVVAEGTRAWQWSGAAPFAEIEHVDLPGDSPGVPNWGVDHVVLTAPDLDIAVSRLGEAGASIRRRGADVRGRAAAFVLAGTLIELIHVPDRPIRLAGLALETDLPLDRVARQCRAANLDVTDPHPAVQTGRHIMSLRTHRLAIMTRR